MPFDRRSTKSSRSSLSNSTSPRTRSSNAVDAVVGGAEPQRPARRPGSRPGRGRSRRSRAGRRAPWPAPAPPRPCSRSSRPGPSRCRAAGRLDVGVEAVGLVDGLLVPVEPEPLERVEDVVDQLGPVALGVGVLDAQEERAAGVAGEQPVEQGGAGAADVQVAGRRRREAAAGPALRLHLRHPAHATGRTGTGRPGQPRSSRLRQSRPVGLGHRRRGSGAASTRAPRRRWPAARRSGAGGGPRRTAPGAARPAPAAATRRGSPTP